MATATAKQPIVPLKLRIEATTMAIREEIMNYFKGTCVERMVDQSNIRRERLNFGRQTYQYQRLDTERQDHQLLYVDSLPLMSFRRLPDTITVNTQLMELSKGLTQVDKGLRKFLKNYLVAVKVVDNPSNRLVNGGGFRTVKPGEVEDEKLFTAVPRGDRQEGFVHYSSEYINNIIQEYNIGYNPGSVTWTASSVSDDTPF